MAEIIGGKVKAKPERPGIRVIHANIGKLTLENEFLKVPLTKLGLLSAK